MFKIFQKDDTKLYVGIVEGAPERLDREGPATVAVTLRDYAGERIKVYFKNAPAGSPKNQMRADRILNAKVGDGAFLSVLAKCSDPEEKTATGLDFKYRGCWSLKGVGERPTSVLMGCACKPRQPKEEMFCITVPVDEFKDGKETTKWVDVTFFEFDREGNAKGNATAAARVMNGQDKAMVVIAGSSITEREYNGRTYYNMVGYRMTRKPE